jgi:hypothetical protein
MGINPEALYQNLTEDLTNFWVSEGFPFDPETMSGPLSAACSSIDRSLLKKFEGQLGPIQEDRALLKFLQINFDCGNWTMQVETERDEILIGELKRAIYNFWYDGPYSICSSEDHVLHYGRCGPGSSLGSRGGDAYTKLFASPLTCTSLGLY